MMKFWPTTDFAVNPPSRATAHSAGLDLCAAHDARLLPGMRALIRCGFAAEIPNFWCGMVCPRSGLALRHGITVLNAPGIIDSDYRGEIGVILANLDPEETFHISAGDRIAQLVLVPLISYQSMRPHLPMPVFVDGPPSETDRGTGGFGSTGR